MSAKQLAQRISIAIVIVLAGLIILLDQLGVFGINALPQWYLIILIALSLICLIISVINKAHVYLWFSFLLGGIYLTLDLAINNNYTGIKQTWPITFICLGIGLLLSLFIKRSKATALVGTTLLIIFVPTILGIWTRTWTAILPLLILIFGLSLLGYTIYSSIKHTRFTIKDEEYYVRPSSESLGEKVNNQTNGETPSETTESADKVSQTMGNSPTETAKYETQAKTYDGASKASHEKSNTPTKTYDGANKAHHAKDKTSADTATGKTQGENSGRPDKS